MRIKLSIVFFMCLLTATLIGQNYTEKKGFIITLEKDTLKGILKYSDGEKTPEGVEYISNGNSKYYDAKKILSFKVSNEVQFESHKLKYSTNPIKNEKITESKEIIYEEEQVFLRVIILGEINLYEYRDRNKKRHLAVSNEKGEIEDLIEIFYKKDKGIVKISKYKNQLKRILYDCKLCYPQIDKTELTKRSLINLIKVYHDNLNLQPKYIAKKEKTKLNISILGGISMTNHIVEGAKLGNQSNNMSFEVQLEGIFPRYNRSWSFLTGIGYRSYNADLSIFNKEVEQLDYIRINLGLKKIVWNENLKVNFNGGFTSSFTKKNEIKNFRTYEQGVFIGTGFSLRRLLFEIRYEVSNGYSPFADISTRIRSMFIMIGYKLYEN